MKPIKKIKSKAASTLSAVSAVGLTLAVMLMNLTGTYFFYDTFARNSSIKEASLFNPDAGYPTSTDGGEESQAVQAPILAGEDIRVVPLGSTFGIKLYTDGVIVTALADVHTSGGMVCPAKDAGLAVGDYITKVNGTEVESNGHFTELLTAALTSAQETGGSSITLTIRRGDESFDTALSPALDKGVYRCGMWIRDSAAGIGTLTFAEPGTMDFAGLGHGICDVDTKQLMSLKDGEPAEITVCGVDKGEKNEPGKINGYFANENALGALYDNNETGIYGKLNTLPQGESVPLAYKEEVKTGPAQILATVDNNGPQLFDVMIESLAADKSKPTKNFVVKITDKSLLAATGGIVQGMSGTPILQNGKLAGAITHVFLEDPTAGYGIFAETMYKNLHKAR